MTFDLEKLKALAEAATQGPWFDIDFSSNEVIGDETPLAQDISVSCSWPDPIMVASMAGGLHGFESVEQGKKDAAFIAAANPTTILALLSHITRVEAEQDEAEKRGRDAGYNAACEKALYRGKYIADKAAWDAAFNDGMREALAKKLFWCGNNIMHDHEKEWEAYKNQQLYFELADISIAALAQANKQEKP